MARDQAAHLTAEGVVVHCTCRAGVRMREQKENRAGFGASKLINWDSATVQPNFVVTHAYDRDLLDEVTLRVGDKLFVAEVWPDGWCLGENLDSIEYFKVRARASTQWGHVLGEVHRFRQNCARDNRRRNMCMHQRLRADQVFG